MKKLLSLLLAALLALSASSMALAEEKSANIALTNSIPSLNPLTLANAESSKYAISLIFLPLVDLDSELNFVPRLAQEITTDDHLHFTIRIREDAVWSDGLPVTAEDVAFSFLIAADPDSANTALAMYSVEGTDDDGFVEPGADHIDGVEIVDEKTLAVTVKWPMALYTFEYNFGCYLLTVPKHVLEDVPRGDLLTLDWFNHPDVISGPYFVRDFDLEHYVHFEANPDYFEGEARIKYLNFNVVLSSQILSGLKAGEIDLVQQTMGSIPVEDYGAVRALENVRAVNGTPVTNESVFINTANVTDPRIRQALLLGMDRQLVFENLLEGNGELVDGFLVSASPYYTDIGVTAYDPEKAASLIAEAKADGADTELTWYMNGNETEWNQAVEYFAQSFADLGLTIHTRPVTFANLMTAAENLEFDIMSVEYTYAPVDPYTDVVWLLGGEGSWTGYLTDEIAAALEATQELETVGEIAEQYRVVDTAMQQDPAMISGWVKASLGAVSSRLVNAEPNVFGTFINVHEWDIR